MAISIEFKVDKLINSAKLLLTDKVDSIPDSKGHIRANIRRLAYVTEIASYIRMNENPVYLRDQLRKEWFDYLYEAGVIEVYDLWFELHVLKNNMPR